MQLNYMQCKILYSWNSYLNHHYIYLTPPCIKWYARKRNDHEIWGGSVRGWYCQKKMSLCTYNRVLFLKSNESELKNKNSIIIKAPSPSIIQIQQSFKIVLTDSCIFRLKPWRTSSRQMVFQGLYFTFKKLITYLMQVLCLQTDFQDVYMHVW